MHASTQKAVARLCQKHGVRLEEIIAVFRVAPDTYILSPEPTFGLGDYIFYQKAACRHLQPGVYITWRKQTPNGEWEYTAGTKGYNSKLGSEPTIATQQLTTLAEEGWLDLLQLNG